MTGRMLECWGGPLDGFQCSSSEWRPLPGPDPYVYDAGQPFGDYVADTARDLYAQPGSPLRLVWTPRYSV